MTLIPTPFLTVADPADSRFCWITIPTGSVQNRVLLLAFAMGDEEKRVVQLPSRDVEIRIPIDEPHNDVFARLIRQEEHFRAFLIQSRGYPVRACSYKCVWKHANLFRECVRLPGFENGACGACVYAMAGARCNL